MTHKAFLTIIVGLLALSFGLRADNLYDTMTSNVSILSSKNWNALVNIGRTQSKIYIVHFYNENDGKSYPFSPKFVEKSNDLKGIFYLAQVNCTQEKSLCEKQFDGELPGIRVFPPIPVPPKTFGLPDFRKAIGFASRYLPYSVTEINDDNYAGFLQSEKAMPKILLFTNKPKGIPLLAKGLSNGFQGKIKFGIVRDTAKEVVSHFNIKSFPKVILHKKGLKKPVVYSGELKYQSMFDFFNVHAEQFVPTSGKTEDGEERKWIYEVLPELHAKSVEDICVGQTKTLCVLLFADEKPEKSVVDSVKAMKAEFDSQKADALKFRFMWVDRKTHSEWVQTFGMNSSGSIQAAILNPGRRKRFVRLEEDFSLKGVRGLMEKILGGDARFKRLRQGLPAFSGEL